MPTDAPPEAMSEGRRCIDPECVGRLVIRYDSSGHECIWCSACQRGFPVFELLDDRARLRSELATYQAYANNLASMVQSGINHHDEHHRAETDLRLALFSAEAELGRMRPVWEAAVAWQRQYDLSDLLELSVDSTLWETVQDVLLSAPPASPPAPERPPPNAAAPCPHPARNGHVVQPRNHHPTPDPGRREGDLMADPAFTRDECIDAIANYLDDDEPIPQVVEMAESAGHWLSQPSRFECAQLFAVRKELSAWLGNAEPNIPNGLLASMLLWLETTKREKEHPHAD